MDGISALDLWYLVSDVLHYFLRDPQYREAQERIGWTEAKCKEMDGKITGRPHV